MKEYTVNEISNMLKIKPTTVRKWIRDGNLKAVQNSKKEGNKISEEELQKFLANDKKYATIAKDAVTSNAMKQLTLALEDINKVSGKENLLTSIVPAIALGGVLGGLGGVIGGTSGALAGASGAMASGVVPVIPAIGGTGAIIANKISKTKNKKNNVKKMQDEIDELQKRINELKSKIAEEEKE